MGLFSSLFGGGMPSIDVGALKAQLDKGEAPVLVDVRTPAEYRGGHIPGTINIPLDRIEAGVGRLDKEKPMIVICRSGARSARATKWFNSHGFNATNLTGGTGAWMMAGYKTE